MIDLIICQFIGFLIVGIIGSISYIKAKKQKNIEYFYCSECGSKVIK